MRQLHPVWLAFIYLVNCTYLLVFTQRPSLMQSISELVVSEEVKSEIKFWKQKSELPPPPKVECGDYTVLEDNHLVLRIRKIYTVRYNWLLFEEMNFQFPNSKFSAQTFSLTTVLGITESLLERLKIAQLQQETDTPCRNFSNFFLKRQD